MNGDPNEGVEPITGIPAPQVGQVVQDFIDAGVDELHVHRDPTGTYTVSPSETS